MQSKLGCEPKKKVGDNILTLSPTLFTKKEVLGY